MAKYAQIEDLKNGEIFRVVEETDGEVYFYDEFRRWCYFNKSEEGVNYRYIPAGVRLTQHAPDVANVTAQKGVLHKNRSGKRAGVALPATQVMQTVSLLVPRSRVKKGKVKWIIIFLVQLAQYPCQQPHKRQ